MTVRDFQVFGRVRAASGGRVSVVLGRIGGMDVGRLREHGRALGFTPQDQVRWLAPGELLRTAVKVVLSSLFADYADRRAARRA
jgi:hypothetical protein